MRWIRHGQPERARHRRRQLPLGRRIGLSPDAPMHVVEHSRGAALGEPRAAPGDVLVWADEHVVRAIQLARTRWIREMHDGERQRRGRRLGRERACPTRRVVGRAPAAPSALPIRSYSVPP